MYITYRLYLIPMAPDAGQAIIDFGAYAMTCMCVEFVYGQIWSNAGVTFHKYNETFIAKQCWSFQLNQSLVIIDQYESSLINVNDHRTPFISFPSDAKPPQAPWLSIRYA